MNTSVRPNTLELDGCDPELLAQLAANDRDTIDDNAASGEREIVTTRPPPPDFDRRVSVLRLRPFPGPELDEVGARHSATDMPGGGSGRVPCDSSDEVTRPLPRTATVQSTRTALRVGAGATIPPPPPRAEMPAIHLATSPRSATPRPRRRRTGDPSTIEWAAKPRTAAPLRSDVPAVAPASRRLRWLIAIAGALAVVSGQTAIARGVGERWATELWTDRTVEARTATRAGPTSAPLATRTAGPPTAPAADPPAPAAAPPAAPAADPAAPAADPTTPASAPARPGTFDARAARRALVEAALRAAACTDPHGGSATAAVTFVADGRAATARVGGRYTGTTVAGCIEQEMKGARVAPFVGQPITMIHVVRLPGDVKSVR